MSYNRLLVSPTKPPGLPGPPLQSNKAYYPFISLSGGGDEALDVASFLGW